uniref:Replication protein A 70 kDa DNA-binding subunit B/D first OB fold domain-containing protein n=1 Tax=Brassica campestris TaxID=3711 RepID=A0A3P5Y0S5_BRACM|nr:unnamed protein product [Brassica rapa]
MAMVRAKKNIVSYVKELKLRKDTSRIEVRIVRLWRNYNKESGNTIEMVVVDKEGTRIHASVGEQLIKKFDDKLREGDAIVLQLFKVYDATGEYRTTPHPYKIGFFPTTFVGKADDFPSAVPEKYFADFYDILGGNLDHSSLVGELVSYAVKDSFTLYLPDDSLALTNNDSSQWSVGTATSIRARFFVLNERLTIREIIDSTLVGTFVTLRTISTIDTERCWQYLSCKYHNKKVMPTTNVDGDGRPLFFYNTFDKEHIDVISRY